MSSRTITTIATITREAKPELAIVETTVVGEGEEAAIARAQAKNQSSFIRESVTAVSADQVRTVNFHVEDSEKPFGPETDARYQAKEELIIECVPETAETVVVEVTDAGGTVENVQFQLPEQVREDLQDDALAAAMQRARDKATRIAAVEGVAVSEVQGVTMVDTNSGMERIVGDALNHHPDADFSPEPIEVSQAVEVVYELATGEQRVNNIRKT